jgi:putative DNA primase/helicase
MGGHCMSDTAAASDSWLPVVIKPPAPAVDARKVTVMTPNLLVQQFNDVGNAERFIALCADRVRYCHAFNAWLVNVTTHWSIDRVDAVRSLAQDVMLEFARQAMHAGNDAASKFSGKCLNSQRLTAMLREAQPHLAIRPDQLDTNPWLLNFQNGTVDLRSGEMRPHAPEDFITKLIRHDYVHNAFAPAFDRFIQRILPGLESYAQLAIGYSLTGVTSEKAVFICYGVGNNGKTTLLATVKNLLGDDYAVLLQIDTLMVRAENNNTQADLADLRGARFVMTSETEEGQRLAEGKLKRLSQGMGKIKAVRKYENPIEFNETHKIWLDCNHRPIVRGNDNAIWNRLHLIPFTVTIPAEEIDRELPAKLLGEAEGILAWAVAGAVRWHREGLGKPPDVQEAGQAWRTESDQIGRFIDECCVIGDFAQARARILYSAYRKWAEDAGERSSTEVEFSNAMGRRGHAKRNTKSGMVYLGIGVSADGTEG